MRPQFSIALLTGLVFGLAGACGPKEKPACVSTQCAETAEEGHDPHGKAAPQAHECEGHAAEEGSTETHHDHEEEGKHEGEVVLSKDQQTLAGLVLGKAERLPLREAFEVAGSIPEEPDHLVSITAPKPCVLSRLSVGVGQEVSKGDVVAKALVGSQEIEIRSPQAGTILALPRNIGETVDVYSSVALLANLSALKVSLSVGETEASRLRVGQKVQVFHLSSPTEVHTGRVTALSPRVDPETRLVRVGVRVDNSNRHLRLGMYVTARFVLETGKIVLSVPEAAVQRVAEVETVYRPVPDEADAFLAVPVKTGERRGGRIEILSGLEVGDPLVIEGAFYLKSAQLKGKMGDSCHGH